MVFAEQDGIGYATGQWPLDPKRPTLIFIHASGGDHSLWREQVVGLADKVNTLALDLPGHGRSRGPGCESIPAYAQAVVGLLEKLACPRPVPCGLSIGGAIVLQLLLDWPTMVAGGVLIGTGARLRVLPEIMDIIETNYAGFIEMLGQFAASDKTDLSQIQPALKAAAACTPAVTAGDFQACDRFDVMDRLGEIHKPVLVVSAEDDRLTPMKYSDYLENNIQDCQRVHIHDAGHLVPIEQPGAVNQALANFMAVIAERTNHGG